MKLLERLHQQLNKREKGSSLVTVLLVSSIVAILVTVVLAIVILNVYMKKADMLGQTAFYDAESALEEIRAGLALDESKATTEAYLDTLSNYSNLDDEKKTENFDDIFQSNLRNKLTIENGNYNISILEGYLKETKYNNGVGAQILTSADDAHFNVTKEGVKLTNVHVKYTDANNYVSEIKTDIVLEYPPVNFQNASSIDNILTYGLIANDSFKPTGTVNVVGNAYLGGKGSDINNANVNLKANGTQETNVISGGNLKLTGSKLDTQDLALWSDSIVLDKSTYNMNSGSSYIKNDLVLGNNARSTLKGKLIMFGNPWVAISEQMIDASEVRQGAKDDMPSYSSSILVTGSNAGLDMSGLNTMVIGGSAYIDSRGKDGSVYKRNSDGTYIRDKDGIRESNNVVSGQSMMLTSDQRAYLVPSTLVGAEFKPVYDENGQIVRWDNYSNGLTNPMTGDQYKRLIEEIMSAKGYTSEDEVKPTDIVNFDLAEPTIGVSLNGFARAIGVTKDEDLPSVKPCFYATSNGGTMVYLFLEFKTVGDNFTGQQNKSYIPAEAFYNLWYQMYHTTLTNYTRLLGNLDYYATYGIKLPKDVNDKTRMYFTGNILSTETNPVIIPDIITQPDFTIDLNVEYSKQSAYYQDAYYTLNKNLSTRYATLSQAAKNKDLFDNLITKTATVDDKTYNLSKTKEYVSPSGEGAVVVDGDVTYNTSLENSIRNTKDNDGNKHSDAKVNVIIATGDVTVADNFEGMIIAGGDVIVRSGNTITSNPDKAAKALIATAYNDGEDSTDCAANFVINAARYLLGGTGRKDEDSGHITMKDFVTYRNWTKQ
ncbi:MAG: hypothetical protein E7279_04015 [Lachnospiraceae bacterium]|nr:hypothetical protein [Lachnospiraceae bacterium]